jgi:hypothetical protein
LAAATPALALSVFEPSRKACPIVQKALFFRSGAAETVAARLSWLMFARGSIVPSCHYVLGGYGWRNKHVERTYSANAHDDKPKGITIAAIFKNEQLCRRTPPR